MKRRDRSLSSTRLWDFIYDSNTASFCFAAWRTLPQKLFLQLFGLPASHKYLQLIDF